MNFLVLGEGTTTFREIFDVPSARAKTEKKVTLKRSKKWPPGELDVWMAMRMVELTIQYTDHPDYVHGPVDAAEIDKGGTVRSIKRKPNCKDQ